MSIQGDILTQINKSITGVTEHTRAHPDDFNPNVLKPLLDNDVTINRQLEALPSKPISFNPGYQIVESEHDAPFRLGEIKGRTLVNLNGRRGNFNYRTLPLPTDGATGEIVQSNFGKVQKVVSNRNTNTNFSASYELNIDRSKHYIAMAYMENISCTKPVQFYIAKEYSLGSIVTLSQSKGAENSSGMHYLYATVDPKKMDDSGKLIYYFTGVGTAGAEFLIGSFAFYEIPETEYYTIATMTPEQVAARYPYIDDMTNVCNPYAIVTGGNLLPPFTEWTITGTTKIISPYEISRASTGEYQDPADSPAIEVIPGETYYVQYSRINDDFFCEIREGYNPENMTGTKAEYGGTGFSFKPTQKYIRVRFGSKLATSGFVSNPMLTIGTEPKPFVPQQRSMVAFETDLAAHPVDGSNPDTLFMGDDRLPYVLEPWGKVTLTPDIFDDAVAHRHSNDYKQITLVLRKRDTTTLNATLAKFDGKLLSQDVVSAPLPKPDVFNVGQNEAVGYIWLTIANIDSGWGPDYKPSREEINAYFLGWKMGVVGQPRTVLYHGEGGRVWYKISMCTVNANYSLSRQDWVEYDVPTYPAGVDSVGTYNYPYRLQYLKANPTVEPVRNYEVGATLSAGSNMVEVGSGSVIRERANPVYATGYGAWNINNFHPSSKLSHKTARILCVARINKSDYQWAIEKFNPFGEYGAELATIKETNFDPTAVYHVTYTMLDPTIAAPISGTVGANLRGTVSDLVQDVGDVQRRLSVVETQKAEKDAPQWIRATLLNKWINYDSSLYRDASYRKDSEGNVYFEGLISSGSIVPGTTLFTLPAEYRPSNYKLVGVVCSDGNNSAAASVAISPSGYVSANRVPHNAYLSLIGVSFRTD